MEEYASGGAIEGEEAHWARIAVDAAGAGAPGGARAAGTGPEGGAGYGTVWAEASEWATGVLAHSAQEAFGASAGDALLAALALAMRAWDGRRRLAVEAEGHGREDLGAGLAVDRTVGWFTSVYPAIVEAGGGAAAAVMAAKEALRAAPRGGVGYGALKWMAGKGYARVKGAVGFNYLGDMDSEAGRLEGISPSWLGSGGDVAPENRRPHALEINCMSEGGRIRASLSYNRSLYGQGRAEALAARLAEAIEEVARACAAQAAEGRVMTGSDYGVPGMGQAELEGILAGGPVERIYGLTPMQEGLLYHKMSGGGASGYVLQTAFRASGRVDMELTEGALRLLALKYPALRTRFAWSRSGRPLQAVAADRRIELAEAWPADEAGVRRIKGENVSRGFDLEKDSLLRVTAVHMPDGEDMLLWTAHHIIMDGWCISLLLRDFLGFYRALSEGAEPGPLEEGIKEWGKGRAGYWGYISWLEGQGRKAAMGYWARLLEGYEGAAVVPAVGPGADGPRGSGEELHTIGEELTAAAVALCTKLGATLNTALEAAFGIVLQRCCMSRDVVFGKVVSGRGAPLPGIEEEVGLFINTVPVRAKTGEGDTAGQLIKSMQAQAIEGLRHEHAPLAEVQAASAAGRGLIQTMFAFENYYVDKEGIGQGLPGLEIETEGSREEVEYPISVSAYAEGGRVTLRAMYDPEKHCAWEAAALLRRMEKVLGQMAEDPDVLLEDIDAALDDEKAAILGSFNDTGTEYGKDLTAVDLFDTQAAKTPDAMAIKYMDGGMTYGELAARTGRLAWRLRDLGVGPGDRVALAAGRGMEAIVGILGVLKAGGAYVPVDPAYPQARVRHMLEDSAPKAVLVHGEGAALFGAADAPTVADAADASTVADAADAPTVAGAAAADAAVLAEGGLAALCDGMGTAVLDLGDPSSYADREGAPPRLEKPEDLAYIIYTSGTTGRPKGVMIEHRGIVNLAASVALSAPSEGETMMQFASLSFDAVTYELVVGLFFGGALCLITEEAAKDPEKCARYMEGHGVTMAVLPPNYLALLKYKGFRHVMTAGSEAIRDNVVAASADNIMFSNEYGPTEVTVASTSWKCAPGDRIPDIIPIGRPIANKKVYILDGMRLCGIGMPGELCIGGDGLARGYLNQPELTAEKFVEGPHGVGRIYRSGDLARWLPDGNIEYLGRIDSQVKVRGYRIELGEIEAALRGQPGVRDAIAMLWEGSGGDRQICAYAVAEPAAVTEPAAGAGPAALEAAGRAVGAAGGETAAAGGRAALDTAALREALAGELPSYMIPAYIMEIASVPLTANGKPDRRALPKPEILSKREYVKPRTNAEITIVDVFEKTLGADHIGIDDDFFEMGGHSLRAVIVTNAIEARTGIRLPLKEVFANPTARLLAVRLRQARGSAYSPIPKAPERKYYPMSPTQRRLFVIDQIEGEGTAYNMPIIIEFDVELDIDRLRKAATALVRRHEALRTSFRMANGEAVQFIASEDDARLEVEYVEYDESGEPGAAQERIVKMATEGFVRPFDLGTAPLVRMKAIKTRDGKMNMVLCDMHHIISDGITINVLLKELSKLYNGETFEPLRVQYKDYSEWINLKDISAQKAYWKNVFEGGAPGLNMPLDYPRQKMQSRNGERMSSSLNARQKKGIDAINRRMGTTSFMSLLAAFMILLHKYSRQNDIVVGTPISGRTHRDTQSMVGMFVNTLALRAFPEAGKTYIDFLNEVKELSINAFENQEYPFDELVEEVGEKRELSRNPLFDVMFIVQNNDMEKFEVGTVEYKNIPDVKIESKFEISLELREKEDEYSVGLEYCSDLFTKATMEMFLKHYGVIIDSIIEDPDARIEELGTAGADEKAMILKEFNDGAGAAYDGGLTLVDLFDAQAERRADAIAVKYMDSGITYRELAARASGLAWKLRDLGVGPGVRVAVAAGRGIEAVTGMLGVLKAGGAYVPIDLSYPQARVRYMLEDSAPKAVLVHGEGAYIFGPDGADAADSQEGGLAALCAGMGATLLDLGDLGSYAGREGAPPRMEGPEDLAYIIYTSGTTGRPKGAMIEHRNVVGLMTAGASMFGFSERDVWTMFHSCSFDFSVWEMYGALLYGGTLVAVSRETAQDAYAFLDLVEREGVTVLNQVPSSFYGLMGAGGGVMGSVRHLIFGGEALQPARLASWMAGRPGIAVTNMYGITETTVHATHKRIGAAETASGASNIGRALPTSGVYIIDGGKLCGIGVPGEICVAGAGVGRGYLNQPGLTAEKFVEGPCGIGRIYRSGDLGRWLPGGEIEYLGRMDSQVKVRGYRIELGEIEEALRRQPGVSDAAAVAVKQESGNAICAYVVADGGAEALPSLRGALAAELPAYMVPAYIMAVANLPLTANGKLDRRALPKPAALAGKGGAAVPETDVELAVAQAFGEALGTGPVGMGDSFFELGGDSIKAIRAVSMLRGMGYDISVKDIMQLGTARAVAAVAVRAADSGYGRMEACGGAPLTPIQREFFSWGLEKPQHFNQSIMLYMEGGMDGACARGAAAAIALHHDALRAVFPMGEGGARRQEIMPPRAGGGFGWHERDYRGDPQAEAKIEACCARAQAGMDIERGPLFKACLFHTDDGSHLLLCAHHLVVDAVSWRILAGDMMLAYRQLSEGGRASLPAKTAPYRAWAEALEAYASGGAIEGEEAHWARIAAEAAGAGAADAGAAGVDHDGGAGEGTADAGAPGGADVGAAGKDSGNAGAAGAGTASEDADAVGAGAAPEDAGAAGVGHDGGAGEGAADAGAAGIGHDGGVGEGAAGTEPEGGYGTVWAEASEWATGVLAHSAQEAFGASAGDALLAALALAMRAWDGRRRLAVEAEGHGREDIGAGLAVDRTVGWFTSIYPAIVEAEGGAAAAVMAAKEALRAAPRGGVGYGTLKWMAGRGYAGAEGAVGFNYLGDIDTEAGRLEGLSPSWLGGGGDVAPENRRPHVLELNCMSEGGRIRASLSYSRALYSQERAEALAALLPEAIEEVARACAAQAAEGRVMTGSDYGVPGMGQAELEGILADGPVERIYGLTPMQEGMLYHKMSGGGASGYVLQTVFRASGRIGMALAEGALRLLALKHPALRARFAWSRSGRPLQAVAADRRIELAEAWPADEAEAQRIKGEDVARGFDLEKDSLLRVTAVHMPDGGDMMLWTAHHIIMDGWCISLLLRDFLGFYRALSEGAEPEALEEGITEWGKGRAGYWGYISWLEGQGRKAAMGYWARLLDGYEEAAAVPAVGPGADGPRGSGEELYTIGEELTAAAGALCARLGATLNTAFEAAFGIVLQRCCMSRDVVFGKVVSGRGAPLAGIEEEVGLFINAVPVRAKTGEGDTAGQLIRSLQAQAIEGLRHEHAPLAEVQAASAVGRGLIQTMFAFENYYVDKEGIGQGMPGLEIEADGFREEAEYPMSVSAYAEGGRVTLRAMYDPEKHCAWEAAALLRRMEKVLGQMAESPDMPLEDIDAALDEEKAAILGSFNDTGAEYARDLTLVDLFDAQAAKAPGAIALRYRGEPAARSGNAQADGGAGIGGSEGIGGSGLAAGSAAGAGSMTYGELAARAGRLAWRLRDLGVGPGDRVAIASGRGMEAIVGILGVLKAGGAYVPIDPAYPQARVMHMLEDSAPKVVLVHGEGAAIFGMNGPAGAGVMPGGGGRADAPAVAGAADAPAAAGAADAPAMAGAADAFAGAGAADASAGAGAADAFAGAAAADAAVFAEGGLAALCAGMGAVMMDLGDPNSYADREGAPPRLEKPEDLAYIIYTSGTTGRPKGVMIEHRGAVNLREYFRRCQPTGEGDMALQFASLAFDAHVAELLLSIFAGASLLLCSMDWIMDIERFKDVCREEGVSALVLPPHFLGQLGAIDARIVISAGSEAMSESISALGAGTSYSNDYGPTEATVCATHWGYSHGDPVPDPVPIGRPICNKSVYILDGMRLCGIGMPGELCIGGEGLARGYLNMPRLTAEKFVEGPHGTGRIYRSGDLARWLPDGNIEYLGRIDEQVKVRGYRIELGEIEGALRRQPGVVDAVAIAREYRGDKIVCAYAVGDVESAALKNAMRAELPDYMVPAFIMAINSLPLTANGKLDRDALPAPEAASDEAYAPPATEAEKAVAGVFEEILGQSPVGIDDSFFELGGDSIKAIRAVSRLRDMGYEISAREFMRLGTPRLMAAAAVEAAADSGYESMEACGGAPLTPIQHEFFSWGLEKPQHFNLSIMLYIEGGLDGACARGAAAALALHHDTLRAVFPLGAGGARRQEIMPPRAGGGFGWHERDYRGDLQAEDKIRACCARAQSGMDLERGPLFKACLFHTDGGSHLLLCAHHLVVDAVSWRMLAGDMMLAYRQLKGGGRVSLPAKTAPYRAWAEALEAYASGGAVEGEEAHWARIAAEAADAVAPGGAGAGAADAMAPGDAGAAGTKPEGDAGYGTVRIEASEWATGMLTRGAQEAFGASTGDALLAALALAMRAWDGRRRLAVEAEGHGREDIGAGLAVDRTVGWFTSVYPAIVEAEGGAGDAVIAAKEALRAAPRGGVGYGALKWLAGRGYAKAEGAVGFNYLGDMDAEAGQLEGLTPSWLGGGDVAPENRPPHALEINGMSEGGRVRVSLSYSRSIYSREGTEALAALMAEAIDEVARACAAQAAEGRVMTGSDYGVPGMGQAELAAIMADGPVERIYGLTPMQEGMLYHKMSGGGASGYVLQTVFRASGRIGMALTEGAIRLLALKYPAIRARFAWSKSGKPLQAVAADRRIELAEAWAADEAEAQRIKGEDVARGFDLEKDSLLRVTAVHMPDGTDLLLWTAHHIMMDGWCISLLLRDFLGFYRALSDGAEPGALEEGIKEWGKGRAGYWGYISWLEGQGRKTAMRYWAGLLEGYEGAAAVPAVGPGADEPRGSGEEFHTIGEGPTAAAAALCARLGATLNTALEAAFGIVLQRCCMSHDVVFGKVVSGRGAPLPGIEEEVGLFINTVPVRVKTDECETAERLIRSLQTQAIEGLRHEHAPLAEVQAASAAGRGLVQTMFAFENYYVDKGIAGQGLPGLDIEAEGAREEVDYPMSISAYAEGGRINMKAIYDPEKHCAWEATAMLRRIEKVLGQMVESPDAPLEGIDAALDSEKALILGWFNDSGTEYRKDLTAVDLFDTQAGKTPDATALKYMDGGMTYGELAARAGRLAWRLRDLGVGPGDRVAVVSGRRMEAIVGILGVLKAGGAYVPIDPAYPQARLRHMLEDSAPKAVLVHGEGAALFGLNGAAGASAGAMPGESGADAGGAAGTGNAIAPADIANAAADATIFAEGGLAALCAGMGATLLDLGAPSSYADREGAPPRLEKPEDLAYIIYTSGTTGRPKGVMIEHGGIVNLAARATLNGPREGDTMMQFASMSFDAVTYELIVGLFFGGALCLAPEEVVRDPEKCAPYMERHGVTMAVLPPNYLALLKYKGFRYVMTAGSEAIRDNVVEANANNVIFSNEYGPTEATVGATLWECAPGDRIPDIIPIGRPMANKKIYILDGMRLCGIGVPGELCIGGDGLARGYMNQPELTAEKFVEGPYGVGRIYRSGDLARWLPDGNIEYLGRIDSQVKVRGYRIELGEIEAALRGQPGVRDAVAMVWEDAAGDRQICAYVVADDAAAGGAVGEAAGFELAAGGAVGAAGGDAAAAGGAVGAAVGDDAAAGGAAGAAVGDAAVAGAATGDPAAPGVLAEPAGSAALDIAALKDTLAAELPAYMIPAHIVEIASVPLTANGKPDRHALPRPGAHAGRGAVPLETEEEKAVAAAFEEVLATGGIGAEDSFFDMGGDSIKAIRVAALLRAKGYEVMVKDIMERRTARGIAMAAKSPAAGAEAARGPMPPTPGQRWILMAESEGQGVQARSAAFFSEGGFETDALRAALAALAARHGALRGTLAGGRWHEAPEGAAAYGWTERRCGPEEAAGGAAALLREVETQIDITQGPAAGSGLFHTDGGDIFAVSVHAAAADSWSWRVLMEDIADGYRQHLRLGSISLPAAGGHRAWAEAAAAAEGAAASGVPEAAEGGVAGGVPEAAEGGVAGGVPEEAAGAAAVPEAAAEWGLAQAGIATARATLSGSEHRLFEEAAGYAGREGHACLIAAAAGMAAMRHGQEPTAPDIEIEIERDCRMAGGGLPAAHRAAGCFTGHAAAAAHAGAGETLKSAAAALAEAPAAAAPGAGGAVRVAAGYSGGVGDLLDGFGDARLLGWHDIKGLPAEAAAALRAWPEGGGLMLEASCREGFCGGAEAFLDSCVEALQEASLECAGEGAARRARMQKDIEGALRGYGPARRGGVAKTRYRPLAVQAGFMAQPMDVMCEAYELGCPAGQAAEAVRSVAASQGALRTRFNAVIGMFEERGPEDGWRVPVIDMEGKGYRADEFIRAYSEAARAARLLRGGGMLSRAAVLDMGGGRSIAVHAAHHCIWDKASSDLLGEALRRHAAGQGGEAAAHSYAGYCLGVHARGKAYRPSAAEEAAFGKYAEAAKAAGSAWGGGAAVVRAALTDALLREFSERPIEAAMGFLARLEQEGGGRQGGRLPYWLMHHGRGPHNSQTMGLMLDVAPVIYSAEGGMETAMPGLAFAASADLAFAAPAGLAGSGAAAAGQGPADTGALPDPDSIPAAEKLALWQRAHPGEDLLAMVPGINYTGIYGGTGGLGASSPRQVEAMEAGGGRSASMTFSVDGGVLEAGIVGITIDRDMLDKVLYMLERDIGGRQS
ncbi:MAG: amino acid adenylation domain-containing protein [Clostridiales Family XIII bacterium]|nr:amino acid adenylation domain-containing protein [Clostridiales Family XIII bacterium]